VGGTCLVEAAPFRRVSRCPNAMAKDDRRGNFRTRVWVRRGIPWIYPRGEDTQERKRERRRAEAAVKIRDKAGMRERCKSEEGGVGGGAGD
jgi:hypothetical protein